MSNKVRAVTAIAGGVAAAGLAFTGAYEGLKLKSYLDPVGVPTICRGHTEGVVLGMSLTKEECDAIFKAEYQLNFDAVDRYIHAPMTDKQRIAFADLAYNVGNAAVKDSTLVRLANGGDMIGACLELLNWVCVKTKPGTGDNAGPCKKADRSKKALPGLITRRKDAAKVCLGGSLFNEH